MQGPILKLKYIISLNPYNNLRRALLSSIYRQRHRSPDTEVPDS